MSTAYHTVLREPEGLLPPKPLLSWGPHGRAGGRKEDEGGESRQLGFYVRAQDSYVAERDDGDS